MVGVVQPRTATAARWIARPLSTFAAALTAAAPAHAGATVTADTTRSVIRDPLLAGRAPTLVAGGLDRTLLRFHVKGLGAAPAKAVLRMRVTDPSFEWVAVARTAARLRRGRSHAVAAAARR